MNEIVAELVDKHLIAGIDRAARNDLPRMINVAGIDLEILLQDLRRRINREALVIALDARESEEEENFLLVTSLDRVLLVRDDIDVVAAEPTKSNDAAGRKFGAGWVMGWPMMPLRVGCIEPVGILNGWRK